MPHNDDLFKKIANEYVERYGRELQNEAEALGQAPGVTLSELRVEKSVRKRIAADKRKRYMPVIATLAACFVIAFIFIIPNLLGADFEPMPAPPAPAEHAEPASDEAMFNDAPAADPALPPAPAPELPEDADAAAPDFEPSPEPEPPLPPPPPSVNGDDGDGHVEQDDWPHEILTLPAPLPEGFIQKGVIYDYSSSIYILRDPDMNSIIITLERTGLPAEISEMEEIDLDGIIAFGKQTEAFSMLIFVLDDVLYTIDGACDIDVLIYLARSLGQKS